MIFFERIRNYFRSPIQEARLQVNSEHIWGYTLTYGLSVKIFTEYLPLSDLFGTAKMVSKGWRHMASQDLVIKIVLEQLGLRMTPDIVPHEFFSTISSGLYWMQNPVSFNRMGIKSIPRELITIAKNNPNIITQDQRDLILRFGGKKIIMLLWLLNKENVLPIEYNTCIHILGTYTHPLCWASMYFEKDDPSIQDIYTVLNFIPRLLAYSQMKTARFNSLLDFMDRNRKIFSDERDSKKINYRDSGVFLTLGALRKAHRQLWEEAVLKGYDLVNPDRQAEMRSKWPSLFEEKLVPLLPEDV